MNLPRRGGCADLSRWILGVLLILSLFSCCVWASTGSTDAPIRPGMRINFAYIVEHMEQSSYWSLSILQSDFPNEVSIGWIRPQKDGPNLEGKRTYSNLKFSRIFHPIFSSGENNQSVESTAPWISRQIYQELSETHSAANFKEGGTNLAGQSLTTLKVLERIEFPVRLNGEPSFVKALKLNRGLIIWDNPGNPLVLKYEPLGIPLITGVVGWKVVDIRY